jgi:hypothetical protein
MQAIRFVAILAVVMAGAVAASTARAGLFSFDALLSGPAESPPNASPGTGIATVDFDTTANTMHVHVAFSGLSGLTTASHIHSATLVPGAGTAGVATTTPTFAGFPLGVTSGTYDNTLDMTLASSYNPAFLTAITIPSAEAALLAGMIAGESYLNIHTSVVAGGEIRGFLVSVPEPSTLTLLAFGAVSIGFVARRRRA